MKLCLLLLALAGVSLAVMLEELSIGKLFILFSVRKKYERFVEN